MRVGKLSEIVEKGVEQKRTWGKETKIFKSGEGGRKLRHWVGVLKMVVGNPLRTMDIKRQGVNLSFTVSTVMKMRATKNTSKFFMKTLPYLGRVNSICDNIHINSKIATLFYNIFHY